VTARDAYPSSNGGHGPAAGPEGARERLVRLAQERERKVGGGRVYSGFVRLAKRVLPLIALGLIALVVLWPQLEDMESPPAPAEVERPRGAEDSTIVNPRYTSIDDQGRPFTITGSTARQSEGGAQVVEIDDPEAEVILADEGWASLLADFGRFDRETEDVFLRGNVEIFRDDGYAMRTEEMHIDLGNGTAWGDMPVEVSGPAGTVRSQGFRIGDGGETVVFTGRSRLVLRGAEPGTETGPAPEVQP
jgi:lipopolysaccharide export system protein LptC